MKGKDFVGIFCIVASIVLFILVRASFVFSLFLLGVGIALIVNRSENEIEQIDYSKMKKIKGRNKNGK